MKTYLERAGFRAETANDGRTGLQLARRTSPDLILLDLRLPFMDGNEVCRVLRKESNVPIIMLTAKGSTEDRITGLNEGADDYIVKPFEPEEVIGRIRAVLRRTGGGELYSNELSCGPLTIDPSSQLVRIEEEIIPLTNAQFLVLSVFMKNPGVVFSRTRLIENAFGDDFNSYERAIDNHIRRLRKLINRDNFEPIKTVYGGGYKLVCD